MRRGLRALLLWLCLCGLVACGDEAAKVEEAAKDAVDATKEAVEDPITVALRRLLRGKAMQEPVVASSDGWRQSR